jgi:hypothetical protein
LADRRGDSSYLVFVEAKRGGCKVVLGRTEFGVREMYPDGRAASSVESVDPASGDEALFRTRTGDPLLTMEVLYQLS